MLYLIENEEYGYSHRTIIEADSVREALDKYERDWDPTWELYLESIKITCIRRSSLRREEEEE